MALDPRSDLVRQVTPGASSAGEFSDLARRVAALERALQVQTGTAVPTVAARSGTLYGQDVATPRLWLRVGSAWHYVELPGS